MKKTVIAFIGIVSSLTLSSVFAATAPTAAPAVTPNPIPASIPNPKAATTPASTTTPTTKTASTTTTPTAKSKPEPILTSTPNTKPVATWASIPAATAEIAKPLCQKSEAGKLLDKLRIAYNERNLSALKKLFTPNAMVWGSGAEEFRVGTTELEKQWKQEWTEAEKSEIIQTSPTYCNGINSNWAAAQFDADVTMKGKPEVLHDLRGSIVIVKQDSEWKISMLHMSRPDSNQLPGHTFPTITRLNHSLRGDA